MRNLFVLNGAVDDAASDDYVAIHREKIAFSG